MGDHEVARLVLDALPPAKTLISYRGYDSAAFRQALRQRHRTLHSIKQKPQNSLRL